MVQAEDGTKQQQIVQIVTEGSPEPEQIKQEETQVITLPQQAQQETQEVVEVCVMITGLVIQRARRNQSEI